jgi:hypothetical protein
MKFEIWKEEEEKEEEEEHFFNNWSRVSRFVVGRSAERRTLKSHRTVTSVWTIRRVLEKKKNQRKQEEVIFSRFFLFSFRESTNTAQNKRTRRYRLSVIDWNKKVDWFYFTITILSEFVATFCSKPHTFTTLTLLTLLYRDGYIDILPPYPSGVMTDFKAAISRKIADVCTSLGLFFGKVFWK